MRQTVNHFIKKHQLLFDGATVVVGVSGGPDSLALLHLLNNERRVRGLKLIAVHVDHSLRGEESEQDLVFVENFCQQHEIIFEGKKIDVNKYREEKKVTVQVAARECRYQFFEEIMAKYNASILALGHHGDDQVETILMRQVRGAYGLGLAGIRVKREFFCGHIIRPFLCISKEDILDYCTLEGLTPRIDQSNFSSKYTRNRFRNQILPILKKENPSVHLKFQQQSELMLDDELFLQQQAEKSLNEAIMSKDNNKIVLSISRFNQIAIPLQRRGFQLILNYLYEHNIPLITTVHIDEFIQFLKNPHPSGILNFPKGLTIKKSYDECMFTFMDENISQGYQFILPVPGMVIVKKGKIIAEVSKTYPSDHLSNETIACDVDELTLPLKVRTRKKGDRMSLKGMNGSKKLKDLFIDNKIDRKEREEWPILVDGNDQIVWVPSLRRSNIANPSKQTTSFLLLSFKEE